MSVVGVGEPMSVSEGCGLWWIRNEQRRWLWGGGGVGGGTIKG